MATRSTIAIKQGKTIRAIYCHWDGYPEGVGATLANYYNNEMVATALINLGGFSSLHETLNETAEGAYKTESEQPRTFDSVEQWVNEFNCGEEYYYLYTEGAGWEFANNYGDEVKFSPLKTEEKVA